MGDFENWNIKYPVVATQERVEILRKFGFKIFNSRVRFEKWIGIEEASAIFISSQGKIQILWFFASNIDYKQDFKSIMKTAKIPIKRVHIDF